MEQLGTRVEAGMEQLGTRVEASMKRELR